MHNTAAAAAAAQMGVFVKYDIYEANFESKLKGASRAASYPSVYYFPLRLVALPFISSLSKQNAKKTNPAIHPGYPPHPT